jgi:hypothetical protein
VLSMIQVMSDWVRASALPGLTDSPDQRVV